MAANQRQILKEKFKKIKYFTATTDIWSRSNRSFIAVSVHYFDTSAEPVLKSEFIACEHFSGRHTHDRVAEKLCAIFKRFEIDEKVHFVTTDGAGEYTAAFKFFGDNYESIYLRDEDGIDLLIADSNVTSSSVPMDVVVAVTSDAASANVSVASTSKSAPGLDQFQNLSCHSLKNESHAMPTDSSFDADSFLYKGDPPKNDNEIDKDSFVIRDMDMDDILNSIVQRRVLGKMNRVDCSAHKVDKLGSIDAVNAMNDDSDYAAIYTSVFNKLNSIWALKDSRISAEIFKRITGKSVIGPHRIRWMKEFVAVSLNLRRNLSASNVFSLFLDSDLLLLFFLSLSHQTENILSIDEKKLERACVELRVDPLDCNEYAFLCEYHNIMSLVAATLNTLEANRYTFGIYLPTLMGLQYKLQQMIHHLNNKNIERHNIEMDGIAEIEKEKATSSKCLPLANAIKRGFENRFGELIDAYNKKSVPLYVAMLSNPTFKLNFMCLPSISQELFKHLKEMLVCAAISAYRDDHPTQANDDGVDQNTFSNLSALQLGRYMRSL